MRHPWLIEMTGSHERAARGIVDLSRVERMRSVVAAADDKHASVEKHRSRVALARRPHRAGRREAAGRWIVNLGAGEFRAKADVAHATDYQHASVTEHS